MQFSLIFCGTRRISCTDQRKLTFHGSSMSVNVERNGSSMSVASYTRLTCACRKYVYLGRTYIMNCSCKRCIYTHCWIWYDVYTVKDKSHIYIYIRTVTHTHATRITHDHKSPHKSHVAVPTHKSVTQSTDIENITTWTNLNLHVCLQHTLMFVSYTYTYVYSIDTRVYFTHINTMYTV